MMEFISENVFLVVSIILMLLFLGKGVYAIVTDDDLVVSFGRRHSKISWDLEDSFSRPIAIVIYVIYLLFIAGLILLLGYMGNRK